MSYAGQPMRKAVFISKRLLFDKNNEAFKDMLMGHMAMDIEIFAKNRVPVKQGLLKASIRHFKSSKGLFRVEANKEYAGAQEAGEMTVKSDRVVTPDGGKTFFTLKAGTYKFKNYTTAGTGPHWFQGAIDKVWKSRENYVAEVKRALKL